MNEQQATFQQLWDKFSRQISRDNGFVDYPSQADLKPQYVTTVIRLPQAIAKACFNYLASEFPDDYHYPISDIHLTLLGLDALLADHALDYKQLLSRKN